MTNLPKEFNMLASAWECSRCGRMNAPFNPTCFCSPTTKEEISELEKILRDPKSQQQFNTGWVAHCNNCGEMLNGLTTHIYKVWM